MYYNKTMRRVSDYITATEFACRHCGNLMIADSGVLLKAQKRLFEDFDKLRESVGIPVIVTSGYRCQAYQLELLEAGKTGSIISAHSFGVALDIKPAKNKKGITAETLFEELQKIDKDLRLGFNAYGGKFVHMDTAFVLKALDKHNRLPGEWHPGARW